MRAAWLGASAAGWVQARRGRRRRRGRGRPPGRESTPGVPKSLPPRNISFFFENPRAGAKAGWAGALGWRLPGHRPGLGAFSTGGRGDGLGRGPRGASWASVVQPACAATTGCGMSRITDDLGVRTLGKKSPVLADLFNAGVEHGPDGARGRDPRDLGAAELAKLGHHPTTPLKALRATCIAHLGTIPKVRACAATECPAWAFRLGKHPWLKKIEQTTEQKKAAAARVGAARQVMAAKREAAKKNRPQGVNQQRAGRGRPGGRRG